MEVMTICEVASIFSVSVEVVKVSSVFDCGEDVLEMILSSKCTTKTIFLLQFQAYAVVLTTSILVDWLDHVHVVVWIFLWRKFAFHCFLSLKQEDVVILAILFLPFHWLMCWWYQIQETALDWCKIYDPESLPKECKVVQNLVRTGCDLYADRH